MRNTMLQIGSAIFAAVAMVAVVVGFLSLSPAVYAAEPLTEDICVWACDFAGQNCRVSGSCIGDGQFVPCIGWCICDADGVCVWNGVPPPFQD